MGEVKTTKMNGLAEWYGRIRLKCHLLETTAD